MERCPCGRPDASLKFEEGGEGESRGSATGISAGCYFSPKGGTPIFCLQTAIEKLKSGAIIKFHEHHKVSVRFQSQRRLTFQGYS